MDSIFSNLALGFSVAATLTNLFYCFVGVLFGTLVAGIAGAGHFKDVGRMGLRAMIYFEAVTTLALVIGLVTVNTMKPGVGMVLPIGQNPGITAKAQTWQEILLHTVPTSIIDAMATGDVLQIVVFSIIFVGI